MSSIIYSSIGPLVEGIAPAGGIQPGRFCRWHESTVPLLLAYDGGGDPTPDVITGMIVIEKSVFGDSIQVNYSEGERVFMKVVRSGDIVYARTAGSYSIGSVLGPNNITANGLLVNTAVSYTEMCVSIGSSFNMGDGTYLTKVHIF